MYKHRHSLSLVIVSNNSYKVTYFLHGGENQQEMMVGF